MWCPYIPSSDDDYDQEDSTTVAVVHGEQVRKILFSLIHNSHVVAWRVACTVQLKNCCDLYHS